MSAAPAALDTANQIPGQPASTDLSTAAFTLDITVIEQTDLGGLIRLTDDGCGSTCGACTTG
jgi:FxLD family lantipeptide